MFYYKKTISNSFELSLSIKNYLNSLEDKKTILGFSGGPDSVATYHVISDYYKSQGWDLNNIILAHYNHNVRAESAGEEEYIHLHYPNVIVGKYNGGNIKEKDLREARHNFFRLLMAQAGSKTLILGHNLTDRLETTIMNLERGCDYNGVFNMQEISKKLYLTNNHYTILRPLLSIPKHHITQYCLENHLHFFVDHSNTDETISKRNYVRKKLIKPLETNTNEPIYHWRSNISNTITNTDLLFDLNELFEFYMHYDNIRDGIGTWYNLFYTGSLDKGKISSINLPDYFGFDYLYAIENDISIKRIVWLLYGIDEGGNITKTYLDDLLRFTKSNKGGYKKIGKWILGSYHGKLYLYLHNSSFNPGQVLSYRVQYYKSGTGSHNGTITRLVDLKTDIYKNKPISKRFISNKIPVFLRKLVPVKIDTDNRLHYLDNLIIHKINEGIYFQTLI